MKFGSPPFLTFLSYSATLSRGHSDKKTVTVSPLESAFTNYVTRKSFSTLFLRALFARRIRFYKNTRVSPCVDSFLPARHPSLAAHILPLSPCLPHIRAMRISLKKQPLQLPCFLSLPLFPPVTPLVATHPRFQLISPLFTTHPRKWGGPPSTSQKSLSPSLEFRAFYSFCFQAVPNASFHNFFPFTQLQIPWGLHTLSAQLSPPLALPLSVQSHFH